MCVIAPHAGDIGTTRREIILVPLPEPAEAPIQEPTVEPATPEVVPA